MYMYIVYCTLLIIETVHPWTVAFSYEVWGNASQLQKHYLQRWRSWGQTRSISRSSLQDPDDNEIFLREMLHSPAPDGGPVTLNDKPTIQLLNIMFIRNCCGANLKKLSTASAISKLQICSANKLIPNICSAKYKFKSKLLFLNTFENIAYLMYMHHKSVSLFPTAFYYATGKA